MKQSPIPNKSLTGERDRAERLRDAGLRATGPRLAILSFLESDRRHPTAEMIHASLVTELPSLSLSTVYSTLEAFLESGLVRRVHSREGVIRVDGTLGDHDHAVCRECGAVFDVPHDFVRRPTVPGPMPEGMELVGLRIEYDVICSACGGAEVGRTLRPDREATGR